MTRKAVAAVNDEVSTLNAELSQLKAAHAENDAVYDVSSLCVIFSADASLNSARKQQMELNELRSQLAASRGQVRGRVDAASIASWEF